MYSGMNVWGYEGDFTIGDSFAIEINGRDVEFVVSFVPSHPSQPWVAIATQAIPTRARKRETNPERMNPNWLGAPA